MGGDAGHRGGAGRWARGRLAIPVALLVCGPVLGQESASPGTAPTAGLRVFLDCEDSAELDCEKTCDFDYLRQQATFVDYVRDPRDAEVHVLVTTQRTGGEGCEYRLELVGRERFAGTEHVHLYVSPETDTEDEERRGFKRVLELGLVPYALRAPIGDELELRHVVPSGLERGPRRPEDDPWDSWLFRAKLEGQVGGEARREDLAFEGSFTANRTTPAWKVELDLDLEYERTTVDLDDQPDFRSSLRDYGVGAQVVKSLGAHWGVGAGGWWGADSFVNLAPSARAAAALEYNVFPYDESSQRRLSFAYSLGTSWLRFEERTIFGRTGQTEPDHGLKVVFDMNRPWGRGRLDLLASQLLGDRARNRLTFGGEVEYRLVRGLSVYLEADLSRIRDQIYLSARGATDEEILLERRALETDSRFQIQIGLSFTFGSIYSTVVNARLDGPGRGFQRIPLADD
jgi:hypothetical protein